MPKFTQVANFFMTKFLVQVESKKIHPWEKEEEGVRMFEPQTKSVTLIRKTVIGRQNKQR